MSVSREKDDLELDQRAPSATEDDHPIEAAAAETEPETIDAENAIDPVKVAEQDFSRWLSEIATGTETDTMLRYPPTKSNSIYITHSQPSCLTQFLSARRHRLPVLLPDYD